ncbi:hypothetical protein TWF102_002964 [Orbilia oligospora]|uniref:Peptidase A1 domain-containing protein n=1 Tax=Orbilia oligospora TaxID=2813651 RepID=A0A7C8J9Z1_ORBOL|nr:hypothetical protein TWF102_002964 [Orbilia oligospora]KAF3081227.1 hypothetical protein TWF706_002340 [Orbilia oligospora]KAF3140704.1 hypothetical protein TWF594_006208 [Orbilia oligospora]
MLHKSLNTRILGAVAVMSKLAVSHPPFFNDSTVDIPTPDKFAGFTETAEVGWGSPNVSWRVAPALNIIVNGIHRRATIDTGSTGALMDKSFLPTFDPEEVEEGHVFYSSSKILEEGYWVPDVEIEYFGPKGVRIMSKTPVLAVERAVSCPQFNQTLHGHRCPKNATKGVVKRAVQQPYFGIGFGRDRDTSSQATPDRNPMINIVSINNVTIDRTKYHPGYIITDRSIIVGLTSNNTEGFVTMDLEKGPNWEKDQRAWAGPKVSVALNNETYAKGSQGSLLVDTGVTQMYLKAGSEFQPDDEIKFAIPDEESPVATYTITNGGRRNAMSPTKVLNSTSLTPYVNTGRSFLTKFDVFFNPIEGQYGLRFKGSGEEDFVKFYSV